MIPLQNFQQQHLGFLLLAGIPDSYRTAEGQWSGECVFMALPHEASLFDDPAYRVLDAHSHLHLGEHRLSVVNDGEVISMVAAAVDGSELFVRMPLADAGVWGIRGGITEAELGFAVKVPI